MERWKPEINEIYYYISESLTVEVDCNKDVFTDKERIYCGNCFKTEEEAQSAAEKVKKLLLNLHDNDSLAMKVFEELDAFKKEICKPNLPKLTAEVFDRPDCPEWAKYAAVHNGNLVFTDQEPEINEHGFFVSADDAARIEKTLIVPFKSSEHHLPQLIKRPAKENKLPDWCKVGEWVYSTVYKEYVKIRDIDEFDVEFDRGAYCTVSHKAFWEDYKPARLRPFNADEMKALMGKVIEKGPSMHIVTGFENVFGNECMVHANGCLYSANDLLQRFTIDNKPCGVLEHLNENGEWIR